MRNRKLLLLGIGFAVGYWVGQHHTIEISWSTERTAS